MEKDFLTIEEICEKTRFPKHIVVDDMLRGVIDRADHRVDAIVYNAKLIAYLRNWEAIKDRVYEVRNNVKIFKNPCSEWVSVWITEEPDGTRVTHKRLADARMYARSKVYWKCYDYPYGSAKGKLSFSYEEVKELYNATYPLLNKSKKPQVIGLRMRITDFLFKEDYKGDDDE